MEPHESAAHGSLQIHNQFGQMYMYRAQRLYEVCKSPRTQTQKIQFHSQNSFFDVRSRFDFRMQDFSHK